jgi:hypothetical protein
MGAQEICDDDDLLGHLPRTYSLALRLRATGFSDDAVARRLDVDPVALPIVYSLAEAKLAALRQSRT